MLVRSALARRSDAERLRQNCLVRRLLADMGAVIARHKSPAAKDVQRVRKIVDLRQVGGDQDDARAILKQSGEKLINFDLRAHIHTHGRLVEDVKIGPMVKPFADDDLLLVAAGKARRGSLARRRLDLHFPDLLIGGGFLREGIDDDPLHQTLVDRQIDIKSHPEVQAEALIATTFGHERDAQGDRIFFSLNIDRLALPKNLTSGLGKAAEQTQHELAASGADQPIKPDNLSGPHSHANVLEAFAGEFFRTQDLVAKGNLLLVMDLLDRAGDHAGDELLLVGLGNALG